MPSANATRVAVCVATFRRQEKLRQLLRGIAKLRFQRVPEPYIQILVVDNDECASAKEVCESVSVPWTLRYVVEQKRGITYARNRGIVEAGGLDFIAFIDDDEVPCTQWLDELLWAQAEFKADVVSGPVLPRFAPGVADWAKKGGFFDARVLKSGTLRETCATNNVLVSARVFRRIQGFDDAFALSGAEDTDFFLRAHRAGFNIVWSQEAEVFELVTPARANMMWLLRREYQTGNGWVFCEAGVDSGTPKRLIRFVKAWGHVIVGSLKALSHLAACRKPAVVRSLQRVSLGAGMLTALMGHRFLAYRNAGPGSLSQNGRS